VEERRDTLQRHAQALIAAGLLAGAMGGAQACELPPGTRLESKRLVLSYRTIPSRIVVGEHFVLELAACPKQGAALPERVKLDAHMPEHRHGMNYRPDLKPLGPGRYRSEGWLFHMPGRWEFVFDLDGERLTHGVRIE
jgi:hypothetical protein